MLAAVICVTSGISLTSVISVGVSGTWHTGHIWFFMMCMLCLSVTCVSFSVSSLRHFECTDALQHDVCAHWFLVCVVDATFIHGS